MTSVAFSVSKQKIISFIWQHILLLFSLYLMTLGVVLCIRSDLGSSVISSIPLSMATAGQTGIVPALSVGSYTIAMNFLFVLIQIILLRRKFAPVQLFQLLVGFVFGWFIDLNMFLTSSLQCSALIPQIITQAAGCTIMGIGISFEVRCGSVTMPGEGITVAFSEVTGHPFPKTKICVDTAIVLIAIASCYLFFGQWRWNIVGPGTLFAMIYVGLAVRFFTAHTPWFNRLLQRPGFRRYIFGLARLIYPRTKQP